MANDYLEDIVTSRLVDFLKDVPQLSAATPPELVNVLPYFPVNPSLDGCLRYEVWPLVDGQLSTTEPRSITSTSFSGAYANFLSNSYIQIGTGNADTFARLAKTKSDSKNNILTPDQSNGAGCFRVKDRPSAERSFVPDYDVTWLDGVPTEPLAIDIDVWRDNENEPWQQSAGQTDGERLQANLKYSSFKIARISPKVYQSGQGWYAPDVINGLRTGAFEGVLFNRTDAFGDTSTFQRAMALVLVGRIEFSKQQGSTFELSMLPDAGLEMALEGLTPIKSPSTMPAFQAQISTHLRVPTSRPAIGGVPSVPHLESIDTSWDTGDLYATIGKGIVLGAYRESPLK